MEYFIRTGMLPIAFAVLLLQLAVTHDAAARTEAVAFSLDDKRSISPLRGRQGYLLVDLEVAGTAPSVEFARTNQKFDVAATSRATGTHSPRFILHLKESRRGFQLLVLPQGLYQIERVNVPYFNFPYQLDTSSERKWRFSIRAGHVNYIGKLYISEKRTASSVDVKLVPRIATDLERLRGKLAPVMPNIPLRSGVGFRDDFLLELESDS